MIPPTPSELFLSPVHFRVDDLRCAARRTRGPESIDGRHYVRQHVLTARQHADDTAGIMLGFQSLRRMDGRTAMIHSRPAGSFDGPDGEGIGLMCMVSEKTRQAAPLSLS